MNGNNVVLIFEEKKLEQSKARKVARAFYNYN